MIPNVPPREASDRLIIFQVSLNAIINIIENRKSCYLKLPFNLKTSFSLSFLYARDL